MCIPLFVYFDSNSATIETSMLSYFWVRSIYSSTNSSFIDPCESLGGGYGIGSTTAFADSGYGIGSTTAFAFARQTTPSKSTVVAFILLLELHMNLEQDLEVNTINTVHKGQSMSPGAFDLL